MASTAMSISTKLQDTGARHVRKAKSFLIQRIKGNNNLADATTDATAATVTAAAASTNALPQYSTPAAGEAQGGEGQHTVYGNRVDGIPPAATQVPTTSGGKFRDLFKGPALRRTASSFLRSGRLGGNGDCCAARRPTLGVLFFSLPLEIQLEIINLMPFNDIMTLRRTSSQFRNLISDHETYIVKQHIKVWVPKYISILYPSPPDLQPSLEFLGGVAHRQRISTQLAIYLAEQIVKEMGQSRRMRKKPLSAEVIGYVVDQLRHGMAPLILALFHFLETYRKRKVEALQMQQREGRRLDSHAQEVADLHLQSDILLQYPDCLLLQIHQMYHLLLLLFLRRLTPPPPIWISRTPLGRWNHTPLGPNRPSDESFAKVLLLGGIGEVWRLYKLKGHGRRRRALDSYVKKLDAQRANVKSKSKLENGVSSSNVDSQQMREEEMSIPIDELSNLWVPAAEKQLLGRNLVPSLDAVSCCGEFVAELLGADDNTTTDTSSSSNSDLSYDDSLVDGGYFGVGQGGGGGGGNGGNAGEFSTPGTGSNIHGMTTTQLHHITGNPAFGMFNGMHFGSFHLRMADDGNWDDDLIEEEDYGEDGEGWGDECCGNGGPEDGGKPGVGGGNGEGPSKGNGIAPVPASPSASSSGSGGYQMMGGSLLSIVS